AIVLEGSELGDLADVAIRHNRIAAYEHAIHARQVWEVRIHHNVIRMWDRDGGDVAIYFLGEGGLIERNDIAVVPAGTEPPPEEVPEDGEIPDP
ncbi:MAG: hypothetical protein GTO14_14255, partial [Anaerolineales bacterium]|nr:hypothetical protein [Anaerolineales bacterium]